MTLIVTSTDLEGLGAILAGLVRDNIDADPYRAKLLDGVSGTVNVRAHDADVEVGLEFRAGQLHVRSTPFPNSRLTIDADADTLIGMSTVPLRFGIPDVSTPKGRDLIRKMFCGQLKVHGMMRGLPLMVRLQKLLSVSSNRTHRTHLFDR